MMQSDWLRLSQSIPSSCLKPGQTHATLQCNIFLHCRGQCVAHVFPPCNNTLRDVWWCWIKFENGQIFVETFLDVVRCSVRLASSFTTCHNTIQQFFEFFFQVLFTTTRFSSVLSCEDLLISSLHRSANIWIFMYLKSSFTLMFIWTQFIDQLNDPTVLQGVALKCWVLLTGLPHSFVNSSLSGHPTFMNSSQFLYCKKWNFKSNSNNLLGSFFTLDVLRPHLHNIN